MVGWLFLLSNFLDLQHSADVCAFRLLRLAFKSFFSRVKDIECHLMEMPCQKSRLAIVLCITIYFISCLFGWERGAVARDISVDTVTPNEPEICWSSTPSNVSLSHSARNRSFYLTDPLLLSQRSDNALCYAISGWYWLNDNTRDAAPTKPLQADLTHSTHSKASVCRLCCCCSFLVYSCMTVCVFFSLCHCAEFP